MQPDILAKKIRENLISQRNKLENYLNILDKEQNDISENDPDKLIEHINLEKNIIDELFDFKKILEPLETMYNTSPYKKDHSIEDLKSCLDNLTDKIKIKSVDNKVMLENALTNVRADLKNISSKNKFLSKNYTTPDSNILDITG